MFLWSENFIKEQLRAYLNVKVRKYVIFPFLFVFVHLAESMRMTSWSLFRMSAARSG